MDVYEAIATRKSVREFEARDVDEDLLTRLLEGARLAPSAGNRQEWRFVAVRDPALREELAHAADEQMFLAEAPVVLACCAETDERVMPCGHLAYPIDVAIAIDHLTLCAVSEGLGTCWIGAFDQGKVKDILGIPPEIRVVQLMPVGYPRDPARVTNARLPMDTIVRRERW